jgi:hypothetical protein
MKRLLLFALGLVLLGAAGFVGWATATTAALLDRAVALPDHPVPVPWPLTADELAELRTEVAVGRTRGELPPASAASAVEIAQDLAAGGGPEAAESEDDEYEEGEDGEEGEEQPGGAPGADAGADATDLRGVDLTAIATERAVARGQALVTTRLRCLECHGENLGGKVAAGGLPMARLAGANLTSGEGGLPADFDTADWERIVRHGVNRHGKPSLMPSIDYEALSDRELSDIIAWARSFPPVDGAAPAARPGPLLSIPVALGRVHLAWDRIDHARRRPKEPPATGATVEYGGHLAKVCRGCHGVLYAGGPILGGDPSWPAASNLTPHPDGMGGWDYTTFERAMREGLRADGTKLDPVMPWSALSNMPRADLEALFVYFQSLPPQPTGRR